jgi:hypothetical protein
MPDDITPIEDWTDPYGSEYDSIDDLLADNGINPDDVNGVTVNESDGNWSLDFDTGESIPLGDYAPEWVWDEFYDYADEHGWDWEVEYGEN